MTLTVGRLGRSPPLPLYRTTSTLLAVLGVAGSARAQAPDRSRCPVELADDAPEAWQHAAEALRVAGAKDGECGLVRVEIVRQSDDADVAHVVFVTSDGRSAQRWIREPAELVTAVKLLRIAGTTAASPKNVDEQPAATSPAAARSSDAQRDSRNSRNTDSGVPAHHAIAVGLHAGARLAGRWSPALGASLAWTPGAWELGIGGVAEPKYTPTGTGEDKPPYDAAVALSTFGGYRVALGSWQSVLQGRVTMAALSGETRVPAEVGSTPTDSSEKVPSTEFRVGVFGGLVVPLGATTRLRGDLGLDLVPGRGDGIGALAVSGLLGVEYGLF